MDDDHGLLRFAFPTHNAETGQVRAIAIALDPASDQGSLWRSRLSLDVAEAAAQQVTKRVEVSSWSVSCDAEADLGEDSAQLAAYLAAVAHSCGRETGFGHWRGAIWATGAIDRDCLTSLRQDMSSNLLRCKVHAFEADPVAQLMILPAVMPLRGGNESAVLSVSDFKIAAPSRRFWETHRKVFLAVQENQLAELAHSLFLTSNGERAVLQRELPADLLAQPLVRHLRVMKESALDFTAFMAPALGDILSAAQPAPTDQGDNTRLSEDTRLLRDVVKSKRLARDVVAASQGDDMAKRRVKAEFRQLGYRLAKAAPEKLRPSGESLWLEADIRGGSFVSNADENEAARRLLSLVYAHHATSKGVFGFDVNKTPTKGNEWAVARRDHQQDFDRMLTELMDVVGARLDPEHASLARALENGAKMNHRLAFIAEQVERLYAYWIRREVRIAKRQ